VDDNRSGLVRLGGTCSALPKILPKGEVLQKPSGGETTVPKGKLL